MVDLHGRHSLADYRGRQSRPLGFEKADLLNFDISSTICEVAFPDLAVQAYIDHVQSRRLDNQQIQPLMVDSWSEPWEVAFINHVNEARNEFNLFKACN